MSKHSCADLSFTAPPTSACDEVYKKFKKIGMHYNLRRKRQINIIDHPVAEKDLQHENHLKNEIQILNEFDESKVKADGK